MPGACFTVLHFWKLRYKMLARPITLFLRHCVKDNVVLQALHHSTNCWHTKPKSTILQPLKREIGFELFISKFSNFESSFSAFLRSEYLLSFTVLSNLPFFHHFMTDNAFRCLSVIYPHLMRSPKHCQNSLSTFSIERVNGMPLWDFCASNFQ